MDVPLSEYEQRLADVRRAMAARGLDALILYSWKRGQVRYLTGYAPNYVANVAIVIIPLHGEPSMVIRFPFDLERARSLCWFTDISAGGNLSGVGTVIAKRLRESGLEAAHLGVVSGDVTMDELPYTLYDQLRGDVPEAAFSDARDLILTLRRAKTATENALLAQSALVADAAAAAASQTVVPGVREYDVVAAAEHRARVAGAEQSLVTIASQGAHDLIGPPEDKIIGARDMAIVEIAVQVHGYWTQVARVFTAGAPTVEQQAIYRVTYAAYRAGMQAARLGAPVATVGSAIQQSLAAMGYAGYLEHDMGHGIGLDMPEPPSIDAANQELMNDGMVLVIHPSIRVPGVGGAFVGGTVIVSADGPQAIHTIPEVLA